MEPHHPNPFLTPQRILSGIQPSQLLTLGNYLGALKNWLPLQHQATCLFMVVDLHAITSPQDPQALQQQTKAAVATYLACGIDPQKASLFIQSHIPEHSELAWILTCFTYMGELNRMTQFKDKSAKYKNIPAGLFQYPSLMAADILLYQTTLVPVGEDQRQHLEITRDLAIRLNHTYQQTLFSIPKAWIPPVGAKIMSLQEPEKKMSKSDPNPYASLFLSDSADQIVKKFKRAVTDSKQEIQDSPDQPGIQNLIRIQAALLNETPAQVVERSLGKPYGVFKQETADLTIQVLQPIREKTQAYLQDPGYLHQILLQGKEKAQAIASQTLAQVQRAVGFLPGRYSS